MRLRSIRLKNFKRFTDLRLEGVPDDAKLVLLIGANGSGKSSIFDAFEYASRLQRGLGRAMHGDEARAYFGKSGQPDEVALQFEGVEVRLVEGVIQDNGLLNSSSHAQLSRLYGRSALRIPPRIQNSNTWPGSLTDLIFRDADAPSSFIEADNRLFADASKYAVDFNQALRQPIFEGRQVDIAELAQNLIAPMNDALRRVFGAIGAFPQLMNFREPEVPGQSLQFIFRKGSHDFSYDVLSFGEKQVFAVLLNLFVRRSKLEDAIVYIDELDLHLNTALQYALLEEIVEHWIPDTSQFWTASHSLGFIRYASQSARSAIFDLDALDFDIPQTLYPATKDDAEVLQVAVPAEYLPDLFVGKRLVYCEGKDATRYNSLALPNTIFVNGGNKFQVFARSRDGKMPGLVDRDYLADDEIAAWQAKLPLLHILRFYSIENCLYHPDNLLEVLGPSFDREGYITQLTLEKNAVYDELLYGIAKARDGYPFARDLGKDDRKDYEDAGRAIGQLLKSDEFDVFYPVFPMKDRATGLPQRHNLNPAQLARTRWFAQQVGDLLQNVPLISANQASVPK